MNTRHYFQCALLAVAAIFGFTSCGKMLNPEASSKPYEVLVDMDKAMWNRPAGRALYDALDSDVPGLPQSEPSFRIMHTGKGLDNTLRMCRNIIQVEVNPSLYTQTKMKYEIDKYVNGQLVVTFHTPSEASFEEYCRDNRYAIVDFITRSEFRRLAYKLRDNHSEKAASLAKEMFGCTFYAPEELTKSFTGQDFFCVNNGANEGMKYICMYSYPYEGPETFNKEYVLAKRDSVMKINILGEKPGMYMKTDTLLTDVRSLPVHGQYAMEARGLWYMERAPMGGPFVSLSRVDTQSNRVIVVEGFVFAPESKKRDKIRRLEGSLYTLMLPGELDSSEIQ